SGPLHRLYRLARRYAIAKKKRLLRRFARGTALLDVGCGSGEFLAHMARNGYKAEGVEPSPVARNAAQQASGCHIASRLDLVDGSERFDAATLWHVLEHLDNPSRCLRRLHALLKPSGCLFIAVPDCESYDARHYGPHWAAWDVPRHLWHFRKRDLQRLLSQHGFEVIQIRRMWLDAFYIALLSERYKERHPAIAWAFALLMGCRSNAAALFSGGSASSMLAIARKSH
ncbi:MAG: class I SAM-dependent methyltransferase, partial [Flavobacteriales bacterium]